VILLMLVIGSCHRYDEGGLLGQTSKHLFGGNSPNCSKTWVLNKYFVNDIDSTNLIIGENFDVIFTRIGVKELSYKVKTDLYYYEGFVDNPFKHITMGAQHSREDSAQCKIIDGQYKCQRNILYPEITNWGQYWKIVRLTRNDLILETDFQTSNKYKLIFSRKK
jgi:hypothetical protein